MVGRGLINNNQSEYRKISSLIVSARMGGLIDFDTIEDRVRVPRIPYWYTDPEDGISDLDLYNLICESEAEDIEELEDIISERYGEE